MLEARVVDDDEKGERNTNTCPRHSSLSLPSRATSREDWQRGRNSSRGVHWGHQLMQVKREGLPSSLCFLRSSLRLHRSSLAEGVITGHATLDDSIHEFRIRAQNWSWAWEESN